VEAPGPQADQTLEINYYGTKRVSRWLTPLIRSGVGRVVNVASTMGWW
jgi:NAD(P)-dependent dehydrogenase (short-subunit alcohol dehydrogenase family)